jgi:hypothetical protein
MKYNYRDTYTDEQTSLYDSALFEINSECCVADSMHLVQDLSSRQACDAGMSFTSGPTIMGVHVCFRCQTPAQRPQFGGVSLGGRDPMAFKKKTFLVSRHFQSSFGGTPLGT